MQLVTQPRPRPRPHPRGAQPGQHVFRSDLGPSSESDTAEKGVAQTTPLGQSGREPQNNPSSHGQSSPRSARNPSAFHAPPPPPSRPHGQHGEVSAALSPPFAEVETEVRGVQRPMLSDRPVGEQGSQPGPQAPGWCLWVSVTGCGGGGRGVAGRAPECRALPPGAPLVSMPPRIHGYLHQPLLVSCSVLSALPFRLQLRRSGAPLGEERHLQ